MHTKEIIQIFSEKGGKFFVSEETILQKVKNIKAFVFDWDGVFNDARKNENGSSDFNEADSMGTNLLRYSYYLEHGKLPSTAIISGEKNSASFYFVNREHFNQCFYKIPDKLLALNKFCELNHLHPSEVCYVFDDVLDLSIAQVCGFRILIRRNASVLFEKHVIQKHLADYLTFSESGNFAVREACELLMGLFGNFNLCLEERTRYSENYKKYITERNAVIPVYFTREGETLIEKKP